MKLTCAHFTDPAFFFVFAVRKRLLYGSTIFAVCKSTEVTVSRFLQVLVVFPATVTVWVLRCLHVLVFGCQCENLIIMSVIKLQVVAIDVNVEDFVSLFQLINFFIHQLYILQTAKCLPGCLKSTHFVLYVVICP